MLKLEEKTDTKAIVYVSKDGQASEIFLHVEVNVLPWRRKSLPGETGVEENYTD